MTLAALLAEVYGRTAYQSSPSSAVMQRIRGFLNEAQQELASEPGLRSLLRGTTTFASVASTASYALPPIVADIRAIWETTNDRKLQRESLDWYRRYVPDPSAFTGTADRYVPLGPQAVSAHPSATGVWAASSSASDTTPQVYVEAVRTGGYVHAPSPTTLTGTARVAIGSQTDYTEIADLFLDNPPVGDVTLYDAAAAGNTLAVIPKGQTRSRYEWIALAPTPSTAITYSLDYERHITDLVNDGDEPAWLPFRFHRLLTIGARMREYESKDDARYKVVALEWTRGLDKLLASVNNSPDRVLIPHQSAGMRRSDLGAAYPAGTIWD